MAPVSAGTATVPSGGDWPMYAGDPAHDSVNHHATSLSPITVAGLHVTHTYPGWHLNPEQVIIAGSLAYGIGHGQGPRSGTYIRAFHLPGGAKAWEQQICYGAVKRCGGTPAVQNGVVFVVGQAVNPVSFTAMFAFNAVTGVLLWTTALATFSYASPAVTASAGTVYAVIDAQTVYALDSATGRILWSATAGCCVWSPVTVAGGLTYVNFTPSVGASYLYAYSAATGALVFQSPAGPSGLVAVSGGVAYQRNAQTCALEAFNASSGALLWSSLTGTGALLCYSEPAADHGIVVVGDGRYLIGFAANTGARLWTLDDGGWFGHPAMANGVVYVDLGGALRAVDEATGTVLYTAGLYCPSPIVAHNAVYAMCFDLSNTSVGMTVFGL